MPYIKNLFKVWNTTYLTDEFRQELDSKIRNIISDTFKEAHEDTTGVLYKQEITALCRLYEFT